MRIAEDGSHSIDRDKVFTYAQLSFDVKEILPRGVLVHLEDSIVDEQA